jgi:hypothetical protein
MKALGNIQVPQEVRLKSSFKERHFYPFLKVQRNKIYIHSCKGDIKY